MILSYWNDKKISALIAALHYYILDAADSKSNSM